MSVISIQPKERYKIGVKKDAISYIVGQNRNLTYQDVVAIIQNILADLLKQTILELELWIDEKVPKRTGRLRANLKDNLRASGIVNTLLRIILGTTVPYAEQVNAMSTSTVRHHGEIGYVYYWNPWNIRGRVVLYDPRAIGNFWGELLEFAKERIMINIAKIKAKYASSTSITSRQLAKVGVI